VVWGRDPAKTAAFSALYGCTAAGSVTEACANADVVCCVTDAKEPILLARHLRSDGGPVHVNAVGASVPFKQEIGLDLVEAAAHSNGFFTDFRPSLEAQVPHKATPH